MPQATTCWTELLDAGRGDVEARAVFGGKYLPIVRGYLGARWRRSPLVSELEDAVQQVFVECLRDGGALDDVAQRAQRGFRAFLYGVTLNVARRFESSGRAHPLDYGDSGAWEVESPEDPVSEVFAHAWARTMVAEAVKHQREQAAGEGERALKWVELLELRFREDLPIRKIAERWGEDAAQVHREYALARQAFHRSLKAVVAVHHPGDSARVEAELAQVLGAIAGTS